MSVAMDRSLPIRRLLFPCLLAGALACQPSEPLPPLPGVEAGRDNWFWRDVLAAPLPGEPGPSPDALASADPSAREAALAGLVTRGDPAAMATLLAALKDPNEGVAIAAARDLGRLGAPSAWPRLIKGLGPYPVDYDAPIAVRVAQAAALAAGGHPGGMELLLAVLAEDTDHQLDRDDLPWEETDRMVFLRELALDGVRPLLGDDLAYEPNASVPARQAAYDAIAARWEARATALWTGLDLEADPGLATRIRLMVAHLDAYQLRQIDGARFTLTRLGPAVLPFLQEGLASGDTYVRVHVLEVMERLAARHDAKTALRLAVVAAVPLVDDAQTMVAAQAARVCGAARIADPLIAGLDVRREPEVVLAIVDALGDTGLPVAHQRLEAFRPAGPVPKDLAAALAAARLATDPTADAEPLLALLASADPDVAYPAIERLVRLTGSDHGLTPELDGPAREQALVAAAAALASR